MSRKTIDTWEIQAKYGHGWETEAVALTLQDAVEMHRQARASSPYPIRSVKVRLTKADLPPGEAEKIEHRQKERIAINKADNEVRRKDVFKEPP